MKYLILISSIIFSFNAFSQGLDGYTTVDDNKSTNYTLDESYSNDEVDVSRNATRTPYEASQRKRGIKLLISGAVIGAVGAGLWYYSHTQLNGNVHQRDYKITGIGLGVVGGVLMISATIPLSKSHSKHK